MLRESSISGCQKQKQRNGNGQQFNIGRGSCFSFHGEMIRSAAY